MDFKTLFRPGILATRAYVPGKPVEEVQRELGLSDVVKLASNENPDEPLPEVLAAIRAAASDVNRYPDGSAYRLTRRLAEHLGVEPGGILLGNGSNEVIDMLIRALVSPGENVVYSEHSFVVYPITCGVHYDCGRPVPLADDRLDLAAMGRAVDERTKLVIVCNPNNPTGTYSTRAEFESLLAAVPRQVIVAVDEAYYEYVVADDYPQTIPMLAEHPNLVVLRSFSKIHSLAGLRVGYGVGHPGLIAEVQKTREPFNVNSLAQAAALACLERWDAVPERCRRNRERLDRLAERLAELGLEVVPSQTNFLLVRCEGSATAVTRELLRRGVIVRPMDSFGLGDGAMRISVGTEPENQRCVEALGEILA
ncbi:MAG: histidinol-phosphate transaminase [Candidatus Krumholzibacteriia bacterium]